MTSQNDDLEAWSNSMLAKGYVSGPVFETYEKLIDWDRLNTRPHVRKRKGSSFVIFFTDKLVDNETPNDNPIDEDPTKWRILEDDEIPF